MLTNMLVGLGTMVICLLLQMFLLIVTLRYYREHRAIISREALWPRLALLSAIMLLLVTGNIAQIATWALLFHWLGEFNAFNAAFYHSAVNFATLGYGDIVMSDRHRLLGPLEALNGVLMIGVSTAALMSVFQDAIRKAPAQHRQELP